MATQKTVDNLYPIDTLVFVAGVSMPHSTIIINSAFNTIPTATVTLPPDHRLFGIGRFDRVPVQIFIRDVFSGGESSNSTEFDYFGEMVVGFKLIFEGDITTFGYVSTKLGREFVINAHGVLAFLRDVNIKFLSDFEDKFLAKCRQEMFNNINRTVYGPTFPLSLFINGIGGMSGQDSIEFPYQYLENAYSLVAGQGDIQKDPSTDSVQWGNSALAEFYKNYAAIIRLMDRFVKIPYFDEETVWDTVEGAIKAFPLLSMVRSAVGFAFLAEKFVDSPRTESIFDLITFIIQYMEFEYAFIAAPTYRNGKMISSLLKPIFYDAHPPACNIMYPSHVGTIRTEENVYAVPTRIRTESPYHTLKLSGDPDSVFAHIASTSFYPHPDLGVQERGSIRDIFNDKLLKTECFTGPYVYDAVAPIWMHKLSNNNEGEKNYGEAVNLQEQVLKTMLTLKQYEYRAMSVESALNLNITPGFPGVVYDNIDTNLAFCGQVLAVSHSISKGSATTTVEFGFTRTLREQVKNPVKNSYQPIYDKVTSDPAKMDRIYRETIGCGAVSYEECYNERDKVLTMSPSDAYQKNKRDLMDLAEYVSFIVGTVEPGEQPTGGFVGFDIASRRPLRYYSGYTDIRIETDLITSNSEFMEAGTDCPGTESLYRLLQDISLEYLSRAYPVGGNYVYIEPSAM